ncbi:hypothetical protein [Janthinobacterium sp.]|uniref:hypothetical protein n=1 Tax=Janthinobacterium sp. TaxID=1871054 RepID=UPI00293D9C4A|nr:hypothetical protein [Janthinobacterium sp.]
MRLPHLRHALSIATATATATASRPAQFIPGAQAHFGDPAFQAPPPVIDFSGLLLGQMQVIAVLIFAIRIIVEYCALRI